MDFDIICAFLGGFLILFGLISRLVKEAACLSDACTSPVFSLISLIVGVIASPRGLDWVKPLVYVRGSEEHLESVTVAFTRLVLGVQLVIVGVQLPSRYLYKEWRSLALLLGPGMALMWLSTSLLVWIILPRLGVLHSLAIGACVTPTDPVLSNSIVKGRFADENVPKELQDLIIAESGANDGLGYLFLFLPLYLLKYVAGGSSAHTTGPTTAVEYWLEDTCVYIVILSIAYGVAIGLAARWGLHWAEKRDYVDKESFSIFAIALALFVIGTVGIVNGDDVLACFTAGNAFNWDDDYRLKTLEDSMQPATDMLLNLVIFVWFGAICPWDSFIQNPVIPTWALFVLSISVLLLRRLPMIFAIRKSIKQINGFHQTFFIGFFGPIGVSAIFYLYVGRQFLRQVQVDGARRPDVEFLSEVMLVVVWFLVITSIIVHGISIPLGKVALYLARRDTDRERRDGLIDERTPIRAAEQAAEV